MKTAVVMHQVHLLADKFCAGKWASFLNWPHKLLFIFVHVVVPLCSCCNYVHDVVLFIGFLDGNVVTMDYCAPDHLCVPAYSVHLESEYRKATLVCV